MKPLSLEQITLGRPSVEVEPCTANSIAINVENVRIIAENHGEEGIEIVIHANGAKVTVRP